MTTSAQRTLNGTKNSIDDLLSRFENLVDVKTAKSRGVTCICRRKDDLGRAIFGTVYYSKYDLNRFIGILKSEDGGYKVIERDDCITINWAQ